MEYKVYQLDMCLGTYIGSTMDHIGKLHLVYRKNNGQVEAIKNSNFITLETEQV